MEENLMNNVFFQFCKKYWSEIVAFGDALYAWIKSLFVD